MKAEELEFNKSYNFIGQHEKLSYMGCNYSGNGYWHQFEKISKPGVVWSELQDSDLDMIELTKKDKQQ